MDIFEHLTHEHEQVKDLFRQLIEGGRDDRLFRQLASELDGHMDAEEKVVYAHFEQQEPTRIKVLEGFEEHRAARRTLGELERVDDGEKWEAKIKVLHEMIEHHVEEEEGTLFPAARKLVDGEQASDMLERFEQERRKHQRAA
jgi:hemerythrin superfamily protein